MENKGFSQRGTSLALSRCARFFSPAPRPQDGNLDFSVAPTSLAAVATNEDSAWKFSAAASFNTAVRDRDAVTRAIFPAPRLQDGTSDFSIGPASFTLL